MRFTGRFTYMDFDIKTYKKTLDEALETQMRQAARAWLRAILSARLPVVRRGPGDVGIPPVWTGTARGSLQPLGRFLRVAIPIKPKIKLPGRGPQVGENRSSFKFDKKFDRYYFRFSTQVIHFTLNEFYQSNLQLTHKTPWGGLKIGQAAFQKYCDEELPKKIPKVIDAIRYKTRIIK